MGCCVSPVPIHCMGLPSSTLGVPCMAGRVFYFLLNDSFAVLGEGALSVGTWGEGLGCFP